MVTSTANFSSDEEKNMALIDALGQLEAIITLYFDTEQCSATKRLDFYLGILLADLISKIKKGVDDIILMKTNLSTTLR